MRPASAAAIALAIVVAGCGSHARSAAPSPTATAAAFKGSPPALAALHAQANHLLAGGGTAFAGLLRRLHGYPVVVNKWASWCGPCQSEFPVFQKVSVALGRKVAFVGIDGKDTNSSAGAFLRKFPLTYPSYVDPHERIASTIQASTYYPLTVYFDRLGKIRFVHAGAYSTAAALERDIRFYVLKRG